MNQHNYQINIYFSIRQINQKEWDNLLIENNNPFYDWEWLVNLETSKSVSRETGWQPLYFSVNYENNIIAIAPLFLKNHSYGEFIFDQSFAKLAQELNLN